MQSIKLCWNGKKNVMYFDTFMFQFRLRISLELFLFDCDFRCKNMKNKKKGYCLISDSVLLNPLWMLHQFKYVQFSDADNQNVEFICLDG